MIENPMTKVSEVVKDIVSDLFVVPLAVMTLLKSFEPKEALRVFPTANTFPSTKLDMLTRGKEKVVKLPSMCALVKFSLVNSEETLRSREISWHEAQIARDAKGAQVQLPVRQVYPGI